MPLPPPPEWLPPCEGLANLLFAGGELRPIGRPSVAHLPPISERDPNLRANADCITVITHFSNGKSGASGESVIITFNCIDRTT